MTRPIPPNAPRQRSERACAACRTAKCKCISLISSSRCIRCERLDRTCHFPPSCRPGRPRRLPKSNACTSKAIEQRQDTPASSSSDCPELPPLTSGISDGNSNVSGDQCNDRLPNDFTLPLDHSVDLPVPDLPTLAAQYQLQVHPFVPILPANYNALLLSLQSAPHYLLSAIVCITFPGSTNLPLSVIPPTLAGIQTAIFLVYAHYGSGDVVNARQILQTAAQHLIDLNWHLIDANSATLTTSEDESEPIRRVWWECWSLEIMMAAQTGIREFVLDIIFCVNYPKSIDSEDISDNLSSHNLKIRALSMARDCTAPCSENTFNPRIASLTSIARNIITIARETWIQSAHSIYNESHMGAAQAARREDAFTAVLVASAAIIYLHTSSYASCVFVCGIDQTRKIPPIAVPHVRDASHGVFSFLRDSLSAPATPHSPFLACIQLVAAYGSITTIVSGGENEEWSRAAIASDLELGEWILKKQALRWPRAHHAVDEIKRLSFALCAGIGGKNVQLMLGIN